MPLLSVRFTQAADKQMNDILDWSESAFGAGQRARYEALIIQALQDLAQDPRRPGASIVGRHIRYHLRHSREHVPHNVGRVRTPRHAIVARIDGGTLVIVALIHDRMEQEVIRRIEESEREL